MVEAVMLVALGFLCATLLALAMVPALARRADRLARKRAEAAFPLSLAEIAADRDHLRAEHAVAMRQLEQKAAKARSERAEILKQLGLRDVELAKRAETIAGQEARIAALDADLAATKAALRREGEALGAETTALAAMREERDNLGAELATRERALSDLSGRHDELRVEQVETGTQLMQLRGERDMLAARLSGLERAHAAQGDSLAAAVAEREHDRQAHRREVEAMTANGEELRVAKDLLASGKAKAEQENISVREELRLKEARIEGLHAELLALQRALEQARTERERNDGEGGAGQEREALRREISRLAGEMMTLSPKREAAE